MTCTPQDSLGAVKCTKLILDDVTVTVANTTGVSFGGTLLYTFPEGRVLILGATIDDVSVDLTGTGLDGDDNGDFAVGTTAPSDGTLSTTDENIIPETAIALDTTMTGIALAASAQFDGTTTAVPVYFNMLIDDADVANGQSDDVKVSAVLRLTYVHLGDY